MADAREQPGWLPCAKLAINSKDSVWLEPCKSLDVFFHGARERIF